MAFVLDDLAILALVATAAGTAVEAKAQSDFQKSRQRKINEGFAKLDRDARISEELIRKEGLAKLDPANELALAATNDQKNAATLAKVSKQIRPTRSSATSGFKGKVSGKFVKGQAGAEIANTRSFKKAAINTGRFLSNNQTIVDRGNIFSNLGVKTRTQRGFTRGNQRVNNIELAGLRPSAGLLGLAQALKIGGAVSGAAAGAGGAAGSTTGSTNAGFFAPNATTAKTSFLI